MDDEILQDFIVEAGEIIENLNEQLVQIEKTPDDKDLLNAIFRGFHTVKGGAGFLQLSSLVEVCHAAESLFDELRNGRINMSPDLMDAVLQAYDEITTMFDAVKNGDTPEDAPADLIDRLHALAAGKTVAAPAAAPKAAAGAGSVKVTASVPGKVFKVEASVGQSVKAGDPIVVLEAMKMEIPVVAPQDGTVASIDVAVGAAVENGDVLATMN